ncbi:zinc finger protein OZF-like [Culex pipiens pallens]|uniref:zinc finger protein OZF-like n=1 Tax=Culex pipiens pallens TaxID=42434 RepID=UPI0019540427|nr:zinc finger protein OZF-like [Culex pipiens pallens]
MSSDIQSICRICMHGENDMQSVFEKLEDAFIAQIIFECTAVQVFENDGLPENICRNCLEELIKFQKFQQKARNTDIALKKLFQEKVEIKFEKPALEIGDEGPQFETVLADERGGELSEGNSENDGGDVIVKNDQNGHNLQLKMFEMIEVDRGKLLCCECLNQFEGEEQLQEHLRENHPIEDGLQKSRKHLCKHCNRSYSSVNAVRNHQRKIESISIIFECETCKFRAYNAQKCTQHGKTHHQKKSLEKAQPSLEELFDRHGRLCCALGCLEMFETESQLMSHAQAVHRISRVETSLAEEKPVECNICFKRFKDDECLQRHLRFKYQPSKNICTICGAKFPSLSAMAIHERSHTKEKPFKCEICCKAFGDRQSLRRHNVKHTNVRPFMCSICGMSFKRKTAMLAHMAVHEPGLKQFKCDNCEKRFRNKAKMLYHMRTHTGEKPYPCRYCEKSFADFSNRLRHEMSHTGEKPYKCSYCHLEFVAKRSQREHEAIHKRREANKINT